MKIYLLNNKNKLYSIIAIIAIMLLAGACPEPSTDGGGADPAPPILVEMNTFALVYDTNNIVSVNKGTSALTPTSNNIPEKAAATYTIATKVGTIPAKHEGITINSSNGTIILSNTVLIATYQLTVTATPSNASYTGIKTTDVTVNVTKVEIGNLELIYDIITTTSSTEVSNVAPKINTIPLEALAVYTIATKEGTTPAKHEGITIDVSTGSISVSSAVSKEAYQLTVMVTVPTDSDGYTGTKTADVVVTAFGILLNDFALTYDAITKPFGTTLSNVAPKTNTIPQDALVTYVIEKKVDSTIEKNGGITINPFTGSISIYRFVPANTYQLTVTAIATAQDYTDTKTTDVTITINPIDISSFAFSYDAITIAVGEGLEAKDPSIPLQYPDVSGAPRVTAAYAIATKIGTTQKKDDGITINKTNGEISILPTVPKGIYELTVTATALTSYIGSKTADITVTVSADSIDISTLGFTYNDITAVVGDSTFTLPITNSIPVGAGVTYTIATKANTTPAKHEDITIDPVTGYITIASTVSVATYELTVTATADVSTLYQGTTTSDVTIIVHKDMAVFTLEYDPIITSHGTAVNNKAPTTNTIPAETLATYSIATKVPEGITVDPSTGNISVSNAVTAATYRFSIIATPKENTGYAHITVSNVTITVNANIDAFTLAYNAITITANAGINNVIPQINTIPIAALTTFAIATKPGLTPVKHDGITIDPLLGSISASDAVPPAIYELTVTATAIGIGFFGSKTADLTVTVSNNDVDISTLELTYGEITAINGTAISNVPPQTNTIPAGVVTYGIATKSGFIPVKHDGITINASTGSISISDAVSFGTYELTVTATTQETGYSGSKVVDVTVIVSQIDINSTGYVFWYEADVSDGSPIVLASDSNLPVDITYVITSEIPSNIIGTIDSKTGDLSVYRKESMYKKEQDEVILIQVAAIGNGNYTGIKSISFLVNMNICMVNPNIVDGKIANWRQLYAIKDDQTQTYTLTNNIVVPDISDGCVDYLSAGWKGHEINEFSGTLEGAGYTISNLFVDRSEVSDVGLIGILSGGIIRNLVVDHIGITSEGRVAGIVGYMKSGTIDNVRVISSSGAKISGNYNIGSLVGQMDAGTVRGSSSSDVQIGGSNGAVYGQIGGLVGYGKAVDVAGYFTGLFFSKGTLSDDNKKRVGGIIGNIQSGNVRGYYNAVDVTTEDTEELFLITPAGLVGTVGSSDVTIEGIVRANKIDTTLNLAVISIANNATPTYKVYNSTHETFISKDYDNITNVVASAKMQQDLFANLTFNTDQDSWTWIADGQFPAINLNSGTGDIVAHVVSKQPTTAATADIAFFTLEYEEISAAVGVATEQTYTKNFIPDEANVSYTVDTKNGTSPVKDAGITIDKMTGSISVADSVAKGMYQLTVVATAAVDTLYSGNKTVDVTVIVNDSDIDDGYYNFAYTSLASSTIALSSDSNLPSGTTYAITSNIPTYLTATINSNTGVITVLSDNPISVTETITVTATGMGAFSGTREATASFVINICMVNPNIVDGKIANWRQLYAIKDDQTQTYTLTNNIVMPDRSDGCVDYSSTGWKGREIRGFSGTLEGAGYTISNLLINRMGFADEGLIGILSGGIIRNLVVDHIGITSEGRVAGIVGYMKSGTIDNVRVISSSGAKISGNYNIGSLVGQMDAGTVRGSSSSDVQIGGSNGAVYGQIGGLVGYGKAVDVAGYFTGLFFSKGTLSDDNKKSVGGIIGSIQSGNVRGYYNAVDVTTEDTEELFLITPAGLVGTVGSSDVTIEGIVRANKIDTTLNLAVISIANNATPTYKVYNSTHETFISKDYDNITNVVASAKMQQDLFANLTFNTDQDSWTWIADGQFPAINLNSGTGDIAAHVVSKQPTTTPSAADIAYFTLEYEEISAALGVATEQAYTKNFIPAEANVSYTVDTKNGTSPVKDAGITIDKMTGSISVADSVAKGMYQLTVVATVAVDAVYYSGNKTVDVTVVVNDSDDIGDGYYNFAYTNLASSTIALSPDSNLPSGTTYAITSNIPTYLTATINSNTGVITVLSDKLIPVAETITVTATGMGTFNGTREATASFVINICMVNPNIVDGKIANWRQLYAIKDDQTQTYTLTNNIVMPDISDGCVDYSSTGWKGHEINEFSGTLEGAGYTISNLFVDRSEVSDVGLIGILSGGIIRNLVVDHIGITSEGRVAGIVGYMQNGTIDNVRVISSSKAKIIGNYNIGGLVGQMDAGNVSGSSSSDLAIGTPDFKDIFGYVGGLVGLVRSSGNVTGYFTGSFFSGAGVNLDSVDKLNGIGGLVGGIREGTVKGYFKNTNTVISTLNVAGLVGVVDNGNNTSVIIEGIVRSNKINVNAFNPATNNVKSLDNTKFRVYNSTSETGNTSSYASINNVVASAKMTQAYFTDFTFDGTAGNWTWSNDGQFPAINLNSGTGNITGHAIAQQPISPVK